MEVYKFYKTSCKSSENNTPGCRAHIQKFAGGGGVTILGPTTTFPIFTWEQTKMRAGKWSINFLSNWIWDRHFGAQLLIFTGVNPPYLCFCQAVTISVLQNLQKASWVNTGAPVIFQKLSVRHHVKASGCGRLSWAAGATGRFCC